MNCRVADFIGYSIFLEIFLEMRFCDVSEVPKKSVFTRLFCVFATCVLANFQDRLVMTASQYSPSGEISLRKYDATACIIFTGLGEMRLDEFNHRIHFAPPLEDRQTHLSGREYEYLRRRQSNPV